MKKSISTLDYIVNISARKLEYLKYIEKTVPALKKHQEAIKDTIANMENSVFLTPYEIKNKHFQEKIVFNGQKIEDNFKDTLEKRHPELYIDFLEFFL